MRTFICHACRKSSGYRRRRIVLLMEMLVRVRHAESRTYQCEHCVADNVVEKRIEEWCVIDAELRGSEGDA